MIEPQRGDYHDCTARPYRHAFGQCNRCGKRLTGKRTAWCGRRCQTLDASQHVWRFARKLALKRDGFACVRCRSAVWLEVNHIEPRAGRGYLAGCWHHQENLETLCHVCHLVTTADQRRIRA